MAGEWNTTLMHTPDNKYIVVDDIPLDDNLLFKYYKQILGCQQSFSLTDKYVKKVNFAKWGLPCMYLSNDDPRNYRGVDVKWLEGNCIFAEVTKPLLVEVDGPRTPDSRGEALNSFLEDIENDDSFN